MMEVIESYTQHEILFEWGVRYSSTRPYVDFTGGQFA
jgi:hypothetical protein